MGIFASFRLYLIRLCQELKNLSNKTEEINKIRLGLYSESFFVKAFLYQYICYYKYRL